MDLDVTKAMVIMTHPDDSEFSAGGTVARWTDQGAQVVFVVVTDGSKGSGDRGMDPDELVATREHEQRNAARVLGVSEVVFLGYPDGEVFSTLELRHAIAREIRTHRPDTVIAQDPTSRYFDHYINHPDHIAVGDAVLAAVYPTARDHLNAPHLLEAGLEPHIVHTVLLSATKSPDVFSDIDATLDRKLDALREHVSQFDDFDQVVKWMKERHAEMAEGRDMDYAEAFKRIKLE